MVRLVTTLALVFVAKTAVIAADPLPDSWPQFRGPHGNGISPDKKPAPVELSKSELWKTQVPPGLSSPCVWGERIFLTGCDVKTKAFETLCLNRRDGSVMWRESVTADTVEEVHKTSSPATATPVCDGERVYVDFGSYGLVAYTIDGKKAWGLRLPTPTVMFGTGASPALVGDYVVLNRLQSSRSFLTRPKSEGGTTASEVLAVDRNTGAIAWRSAVSSGLGGRSHATPVLHSRPDGDHIIMAAGSRITALDAKTGNPVWWTTKLPLVSTASPVIAGDWVFVNNTGMAGDIDRVEVIPFEQALKQWDKNKDGKLQRDELPNDLAVFTRHREDREGDFSVKQFFFNMADANRDGALDREEWDRIFKDIANRWTTGMKPALVALKLGGTGDIGETHIVWQANRGVPEVPTLLVHDNIVYAVRNGGVVSCFDAATGKILYEERLGASGSYYSSPVTDGVNIYFVSQPGVVTVIRAGNKFQRVSRHDLREDVGATPAIIGGQLFIRGDKSLFAYGPDR